MYGHEGCIILSLRLHKVEKLKSECAEKQHKGHI